MATKPNVLLILADDLGFGDLGCFGNSDVSTPNIDALARNGVRLTQHYSASAVCAPARAAMLTGRYPHRTGAIDTLEGRGLDRLNLRERTLADILKADGYATGLVGKWHNGALDPAYHPNRRGFETFVGFRGGWQDYYEWRLDKNGMYQKFDGRYLTDVLTEHAVSFIERNAANPFFLKVAYNAPHTPLQVPDEDADPFRATGKHHEAVSRLYGMVHRMDTGIGRILETLQASGLERNTFVIFTSDNGPQFGSEFGPDSLRRANALFDADRFNGHKGNVYEGGIRVPAVLRWPDGLPSDGSLNAARVHFTDYLPTLLAAADVPVPSDNLPLDGISRLDVLRGEASDNAEMAHFWQWNRYTPVPRCNASVRIGDWKLLYPTIREAMQVAEEDLADDRRLKYQPETFPEIARHPEPQRDVPPPLKPLLFDLASDPCEQNDLADAQPERIRQMTVRLDEWFDTVETERQHSAKSEA